MTRLNVSALLDAAMINNDITIHRQDGSMANYTLKEVNQHALVVQEVAIVGGPAESLTDDMVTGITMTADHYDECLAFLQQKEEQRLAEELTLNADDPFLTNRLSSAEKTILADAVSVAEGSISDAMYAILNQMEEQDTGALVPDESFLQRWALPLALLCGKYQHNNQLGFVYWMSRALKTDPALLIRTKPAVWLAYMYQCTVYEHYDVLTEVLSRLIAEEPVLACEALLYLCTLNGLKPQAEKAWQQLQIYSGDRPEQTEQGVGLECLLLYFPINGDSNVYSRYSNAVELILSNGWLAPTGASDAHAVVYDYQRLHGYMFAVNASLSVCFINKSDSNVRWNVENELQLARNEQANLPNYIIKMTDTSVAKIIM